MISPVHHLRRGAAWVPSIDDEDHGDRRCRQYRRHVRGGAGRHRHSTPSFSETPLRGSHSHRAELCGELDGRERIADGEGGAAWQAAEGGHLEQCGLERIFELTFETTDFRDLHYKNDANH